MKRATVLALIMFFILIGTASAFEVKLFEGTFIRESDKPFTESKVFNASGDESNPILKLFSGGLNGIKKESVSSATVELNGTTVFKASDFNTQVEQLPKNRITILWTCEGPRGPWHYISLFDIGD